VMGERLEEAKKINLSLTVTNFIWIFNK
jgi:hypothetical protein